MKNANSMGGNWVAELDWWQNLKLEGQFNFRINEQSQARFHFVLKTKAEMEN